jgi:hypothetical protein
VVDLTVDVLVGAVDEDSAQLAGADLYVVDVEPDRLAVGLVDIAVRVSQELLTIAPRILQVLTCSSGLEEIPQIAQIVGVRPARMLSIA